MINPSVSVAVKSLLTLEMAITPASGEPTKFLISEGARLTNLKYLDDGKEVIASGVVKVIKWNFIKLPDNDASCVHSTKSVFSRQCQPKSLIMDCSGEFESDVREIPVLAIRGCESIDDGYGDPTPATKPAFKSASIDGIVDLKTGTVTDASIILTFDRPFTEEELDEFVGTTSLTITDTTVQTEPLSGLAITDGHDGTIVVDLVADLSMEKLSAGDMVVIQSESEGTRLYMLTENDIPGWVNPTIEFSLSAVTVNDAEGTISVTINEATDDTDPEVVIMNNREIVNYTMEDNKADDQTLTVGRTVRFEFVPTSLKTADNTIKVIGPGYNLVSEAFDGVPPTALSTEEVEKGIQEAIAEIKTALANGDGDAITQAMHVNMLKVGAIDQIISGVKVGAKTYSAFDDVVWSVGDTIYHDALVTFDDDCIGVHVLPLLEADGGTADVTILMSSPANSTGRFRALGAIEYPVGTFSVYPAGSKLTLSATDTVEGKPGYKHEFNNTETGAVLIREDKARLAVTPMVGGTAVANGSLVLMTYDDGEQAVSDYTELSLLSTVILLPPHEEEGVNTEIATVRGTASVVIPGVGAATFDFTINDLVRPVLAVTDMGISGEIDYDGVITNPEIAFNLSRVMDKTTIANGVLTVYGTTIMKTKIGVLSSNITVNEKAVTVVLPDALDASEIKNGTVAVLTIGDETAIVDVTVPTYVPPVFRGAAITGNPDFETGAMTDGKLVLTFNETIDTANLKVTVGDGATINIGTTSGVTNEAGVISVPLNNANAADYQSFAKIDVVVTRGNESFKAIMTKGTHYPTWETPPVLQRVQLTGTPDTDTGMIDNPVVKVTLDKTTNMDGATVSIDAMGITGVALTGPNAVPVDNVISVSLTEGVSLANVPDTGVAATMVNKTCTRTYDMVVETDYPKWVLPLRLTRVQITDDTAPETPTATIANATITLTFNQAADLSTMTTLELKANTTSEDGETTETVVGTVTLTDLTADESGVATVAATNLNMEFTGELTATISGTDADGQTFTYVLTDEDYPKYTTPTVE